MQSRTICQQKNHRLILKVLSGEKLVLVERSQTQDRAGERYSFGYRGTIIGLNVTLFTLGYDGSSAVQGVDR